jgi:hypothetical protein
VMPKVQQALHRSHAGRRERIGTFDTRYPGPETGVLPLWVQADPITLTYPSEFVTRVSARAGSAIVFTEYMMHTTYPWTRGERKSIFYKYSARNSSVPIVGTIAACIF